VARLNPLGKVPALVRDDDEVLFDSPMIMEYLDSLKGAPLIPPPGESRWQAQRWHALAQGMMDATVARLMETRRVSERQEPSVIRKQEGKVAAALSFAEQRIPDGEFLVGDVLTVADIALGAALGYLDLRYVHEWRGVYPRLARWFERFGRRPSFIETAPA